MRTLLALALILAAAAPAAAQVRPYPGAGWPGATIGDVHRYEMDRLRNQSAERDASARQQQLDARLTVLELQAARRPEPIQPPPYRALRSPEQERALRESATARREQSNQSVGEIDAWLDAGPK